MCQSELGHGYAKDRNQLSSIDRIAITPRTSKHRSTLGVLDSKKRTPPRAYEAEDHLQNLTSRRGAEDKIQRRGRRPPLNPAAPLLIILLLTSLNLPGVTVSAQTIGDTALLTGVLTSPDGPIEGIIIALNMDLGESFSPIENVTTDVDGSYEFMDVPIGHPYLIEFNHGGVSHLRKFEVTSITQVQDFNLSGTVNFRINGVEGAPMEGVEVDIVIDDSFRVGSTQTDSSGSGSFTHLDIDAS